MMENSYKWYAVYTKSRAEKQLHNNLVNHGIESFLPLVKALKQWSDRKKWVSEPLIRSYVFVKVSQKEFYKVLNLPGAVFYVSFNGQAASIPDEQILSLKTFWEKANRPIEIAFKKVSPGSKIKISSGPMKGLSGEVIQIRGRRHIVIRLDCIGCNLHTEIAEA